MIHFRAQREAARARRTLFYAQACDRTEKGGGIQPDIAHAALRNMNVNKTGGVPSMFVWHLGMRMRLKIKLSARRKIMQDATGVVVGFDVPLCRKARSSTGGENLIGMLIVKASITCTLEQRKGNDVADRKTHQRYIHKNPQFHATLPCTS